MNFCDKHQEVISKTDADIAAKVKQQKLREQQLEEKNRLAKKKKQQENENIQQQRLAAQERLLHKKKSDKIKREKFSVEVEKIRVGTTITATLEDGHQASMELNVITSTTKRYIFNDRTCQHKLALTKDKIVDMRVELLGNTNHYQSLENMISTRRNQLEKK